MTKGNEKKRVIAAKLRRLCNDGTPERLLWRKVKEIIYSENEYSCEDAAFLANLIDIDTCTNEGVYGYTYQCSACLHRDFIDGCDWNYCPHCGAEIVWSSE